jgi:hypothetical protein
VNPRIRQRGAHGGRVRSAADLRRGTRGSSAASHELIAPPTARDLAHYLSLRRASPSDNPKKPRGKNGEGGIVKRLTAGVAEAQFGKNARVPTYRVNRDAVRHAKQLIDARQYVLRSRWQDVQPRAREQNAFLKTHPWEEYAAWHLGLTEGVAEETKARYAFVYGDLRRLHRMGLIACHYRAAEWRHKEIELAAHELLQYLDRKTAR